MIRFTAERDDRTFVDAQGVRIHFHVWKVGRPKAIVQISHGLGEYAARYENLAQDLVAAGYTVYADDHRGHGQTGVEQYDGDRTKLGHLGPGGLNATVESVRHMTRIIREENPDTRLVLLGHSWGSIIVQKIIDAHADEYEAVVLSGTALRTLRHMNGGKLNKKHEHLGATGYEWLSRDPAVSQAFLSDDLTFSAEAITLFGLPDALRLLGKPSKNMRRDIPLLIQVGGDDPFGGEQSAVLLAEAYLGRSGLSDVELIVYPDARHEIYNEINSADVVADLIRWIDGRVAADFPAR